MYTLKKFYFVSGNSTTVLTEFYALIKVFYTKFLLLIGRFCNFDLKIEFYYKWLIEVTILLHFTNYQGGGRFETRIQKSYTYSK